MVPLEVEKFLLFVPTSELQQLSRLSNVSRAFVLKGQKQGPKVQPKAQRGNLGSRGTKEHPSRVASVRLSCRCMLANVGEEA